MRVVTYGHAYHSIFTFTLCAECAEHQPMKGPVLHGIHEGTCESCEADESAVHEDADVDPDDHIPRDRWAY